MATLVSIGPAPPPPADAEEDPANEVDPDGGYEGAPFVEPGEGEDECPDWLDFDPVAVLADEF